MAKYIDDETQVEFLPVKAHSEEYGEKQYYILHFLKIHDTRIYQSRILQKVSHFKPLNASNQL